MEGKKSAPFNFPLSSTWLPWYTWAVNKWKFEEEGLCLLSVLLHFKHLLDVVAYEGLSNAVPINCALSLALVEVPHMHTFYPCLH